jgi:hypothetical protein
LKKTLEDGKNSHANGWAELNENGYSTKSNPEIECDGIQNSNAILCKSRKINSEIHMEE